MIDYANPKPLARVSIVYTVFGTDGEGQQAEPLGRFCGSVDMWGEAQAVEDILAWIEECGEKWTALSAFKSCIGFEDGLHVHESSVDMVVVPRHYNKAVLNDVGMLSREDITKFVRESLRKLLAAEGSKK